MGPDYSKAKTREEKRAIHKAFWGEIHQQIADGKWGPPMSREEFFKQTAAIIVLKRKEKEQREREQKPNEGDSPSADNAA